MGTDNQPVSNVFEMPLRGVYAPVNVLQAFLIAFHRAIGKEIQKTNYTSKGAATVVDFGGYLLEVDVKILGPANTKEPA